MIEQAGWVFVQRFLVPNCFVDVRHFGCGLELVEATLHSQQSNEDTIEKIMEIEKI